MRDTVLHFGTKEDSFQTNLKRYAAAYGLKFDCVERAEARRWRQEVIKKIDRAAFVFIWNGMQHMGQNITEYCKSNGVPRCYFEYGMLPQNTTFYVDPDGFCGRSRLCRELSWVTQADMDRMHAKRAELQAEHPLSDNGDILVPMQIFADTQILYHTHYRTMQDFAAYLKTIFPSERLLLRPHPSGAADYDRLGLRVENSKQVGFMESAARVHSVVGLTSTTLMEAVVLGKPVLALGNCALRAHNPSEHDRVAAGSLALTIDRQKGEIAPILERFSLRPLCSQPLRGVA